MQAYRITFDDFEAIQNLHLGNKRWIMQTVTGVITLVVLGRSLWLGQEEYPISQALIFAGLLLASGFIFAPWALRRRYQKAFAAQETLQEETRIESNEEGVVWESESGRVKFRWDDLVGFKEGKSLILLYESPLSMRPVPLRAFEGSEEKEAFLERLRA
jgi:hypothetical protein